MFLIHHFPFFLTIKIIHVSNDYKNNPLFNFQGVKFMGDSLLYNWLVSHLRVNHSILGTYVSFLSIANFSLYGERNLYSFTILIQRPFNRKRAAQNLSKIRFISRQPSSNLPKTCSICILKCIHKIQNVSSLSLI